MRSAKVRSAETAVTVVRHARRGDRARTCRRDMPQPLAVHPSTYYATNASG